MGEKQTKPFQLSFNGLLKVDFQGSHVTSDGGLILVRELDERLGLGELIDEHLSDSRQGTNKQFTLADLLRQSVYSRLTGYEDLNDAARVSADPTFRLIGSEKNWNRGAALDLDLAWIRDGNADERREPARVDGGEPGTAVASRRFRQLRSRRSRHGFDRKPRPWATGRERLQRPFRVGLQPPAVVVQPARRLSGGEAALRECPQRRGLG